MIPCLRNSGPYLPSTHTKGPPPPPPSAPWTMVQTPIVNPRLPLQKHQGSTRPPKDSGHPLPHPTIHKTPSQPTYAPPAFAPRAKYVKPLFRGNPTVDMKLRWLSGVTETFQLDRELAEVKMSGVTSRFVYISGQCKDIIERVTNGEFLSLFQDVQDSVERPMKFPTYLITCYPVDVDPSLAKELPCI